MFGKIRPGKGVGFTIPFNIQELNFEDLLFSNYKITFGD